MNATWTNLCLDSIQLNKQGGHGALRLIGPCVRPAQRNAWHPVLRRSSSPFRIEVP